MENKIEIPFGAKDSELKGWEYTIPEDMEAEIKDGKIIVKQKESEDERIRKKIISIIEQYGRICEKEGDPCLELNDCLAYLEKHTESTWTEEDESFMKCTLPRILEPDNWTLEQNEGDKERLKEFISRQKNKYIERQKEQEPTEYEEDSNDETKQSSPSLDITESARTDQIEALKNLLSYLKYERKSTQEEIKLSFIPCIEKLLEMIGQKPIFRVGDYVRNIKNGDKVIIEQLDIATKAYCYISHDGVAEIHSDFPFSKQDEWEVIGHIELKPAESEDKRIGNLIYCIVRDREDVRATLEANGASVDKALAYLENQIEQKPVHTAKEMWKEMRLEVYAQASGNRHEPNYSDDSTKMFSLCDIDEIFEKIGNSIVEPQHAEWSDEDEKLLNIIISDVRRTQGSCGIGTDEWNIHSKAIRWLKSRHPSWKPSKEQMDALNEIINTLAASKHPHESDYLFNILNGLRKSLKKL